MIAQAMQAVAALNAVVYGGESRAIRYRGWVSCAKD